MGRLPHPEPAFFLLPCQIILPAQTQPFRATLEAVGNQFRLEIPERLRVGHEAHFGSVTRLFLDFLADPSRLPTWEDANMRAKYFVTTHGVHLARQMS